MFMCSPPEVQRVIAECHDQAVLDSMRGIEDDGARVRRGWAARGTLRSEGGEGLVAVIYRHRTSRPVDMLDGTTRIDPQLHSHVLVANRIKGPDGRWTAADGQRLYQLASRTATSTRRPSGVS
jgi:hypothetical protein